MGECGCGSFTCEQAVRVGDYILAVEVYRGCADCQTGLMVTLHIFTVDEARHWDIEKAETFAPDQYGHAQLDFPLFGHDELIGAAHRLNVDTADEFSANGYENLRDFFEDYGLSLLQTAWSIKQAELEAQNRKLNRKAKK